MIVYKIISAILSLIILFYVWFFGFILIGADSYNPIKPDIDTKFSDRYDEDKFNSIEAGMDTTELLKILGEPIDVGMVGTPKGSIWYYSSDGGCEWYGFAWLGREVIVNKGKVVETVKSVHFD